MQALLVVFCNIRLRDAGLMVRSYIRMLCTIMYIIVMMMPLVISVETY